MSDPILDAPLSPAYPVGYEFFIHNQKAIEAAARQWYLEANGREPADADVSHGLWRGINECDRWGTFRNAWQNCWPKPNEPYPPTSDKLNGSLTIVGNYPKGPRPNRDDNCLFVDELDTLPDDVQDRALDQMIAEGHDHITVGPIVAKGYDGDYDDTNWVNNYEPILSLMRKARRRGLRVVLTALPDVEPYFHTDEQNGGTWDWALIERDFTPFFTHPEVQELVEDIQHGWENVCANAEFVRVFAYLSRVFPKVRGRWWHGWPDHSAPGLSSEPISEGEMIRRCKDAGMTGVFWQSGARGRSDDERNEAGRTPIEQFRYDVMDFERHCRDGYGGWPGGVDCRPREYYSYWRYRDNMPMTPEDWGEAARQEGAIGAMDGGPKR